MEQHKLQYEESLQNKILNGYIRIINIPIGDRKEFNLMIEDFLSRVGYDREVNRDPQPLAWPRPAGIGEHDGHTGIIYVPSNFS
ncbi:unnamed protein product [Cylicocyclus nassatus]|uniref:Uncharacterized protein n=1 Tax=Cylicocyclus nassatus TaxID=53992 RepID=A0AA36DRU2_CYLNA|nr:unnamed protein product [Cylicocyclus nassatus]